MIASPPIGGVGYGAMCYRDGLLWIGRGELFMSPDSGKTWAQRSPLVGGNIMEVHFFDKYNGIIANVNGNIYLTHDQGLNWQEMPRSDGAQYIVGAKFGASLNEIYVCHEDPGIISISRDGGFNWSTVTLAGNGDWVQRTLTLKDGSTLALVTEFTPGYSSLYKTTDQGINWSKVTAPFGTDTWGFAVDSCDPNFIYVSNESGGGPDKNNAAIYRSSDGGLSWSTPFLRPNSTLTGSVELGRKAVYFQTPNEGIYRSTDHGLSWQQVGGPSNAVDSKMVAVINDNLVIAADLNGNIWQTTNGGGIPVSTSNLSNPSILESSLFNKDTVSVCATPLPRTLHLLNTECGSLATILLQRIVGDSNSYSIAHKSNPIIDGEDSIVVAFDPTTENTPPAFLELLFADSTVQRIPLRGSAQAIATAVLSGANVRTDTIGGEVYLPIVIRYQGEAYDLPLVVTYDTSMLIFNGAITETGESLKSELLSLGRARLVIPEQVIRDSKAREDSLMGYAIFQVFPRYDSCVNVTIGIAEGNCVAATPQVSAQICSPVTCGSHLLSGFMRYGPLKYITVTSNPQHPTVSITAEQDLTGVAVTVVDLLGRSVYSKEINLLKEIPYTLDLQSYAEGTYYIITSTHEFSRILPIIKN